MRLNLLVSALLSVFYVAALPRTLYERAPPLDTLAVIKQCTAKGTQILADVSAATGDTAGISDKYDTLYRPLSTSKDISSRSEAASGIREVLVSAGLQVSDQITEYVVKRRARYSKAAYTNYFDIEHGVIVAAANFNYLFFYEPNERGSLPANGARQDEPNALGWNQIVGEQYKSLTGGKMSTLQHILQYEIANPGTLAVMRAVLDAQPPLPQDEEGWTVVPPEHTMFSALLGTDNGKGGGRMLKDYRASMSGKALTAIRIKEDDLNWCMIEDYA
ncbi:hypothetical protein DFH06DRAFT_147599 [Mycena polygramma]|nr:hypothetical protein DFH06DRAFT_147599 [Mycena polygramma]